ncbi:MAG: D-tyrosyl-tRNA(Tyr) deacylase [Candidatus Marinimicrobia bacterium]|nr:D-tyrosyl-tRNA(Tyr) deacylase [Candidatus Neomarinimicrobiota bacterium]|tara:strand:+ start:2494 stop:2940 length:447 start_codon:yes stop_codon:yes gene_type:complete
MIVVAQRCSSAKVLVNKTVISEINLGLLLLVGIEVGDGQADIKKVVKKISHLRIFEDDNKKMNLSIIDISGSLLVVSQFTLCGDIKKGRRPSFINAESPKLSLRLYEDLMSSFRENNIQTLGGAFGQMMDVELINKGPTTFIINSKEI